MADENRHFLVMCEQRQDHAPSGQRMQRWISVTLITGVLLSAALITIGLLRLLAGNSQPGEPATVTELIQQQTHTTSLGAIFEGVETGRATSLIRLGVFVLILTPVARVALTLMLFLAERDWMLAFLAVVVLALLLLGITGTVG